MAIVKYSVLRSYESTFESALADLLTRVDGSLAPLRFVFFGNPLTQEQYAADRFLIEDALYDKFGSLAPVFSYVAQPPLASTLVVECQMVDRDAKIDFRYLHDQRYAVVQSDRGVMLFTGGILPVDLGAPIIDQSREVFSDLSQILSGQGLEVNDISRQWNYIEQITELRHGMQNYQQFNDARSDFYSTVEWADGYPAATGIGTDRGGVMVEVDAARLSEARVVALDNSLQVAAHAYSNQVLLGSKVLSTPKFERAKAVDYGGGSVKIYISGTAAIRGEQSLLDVGIEEQTLATLENIEWLVGAENMVKHGISIESDVQYKIFRVYLKFRSHFLAARDIISKRYPNLPVIYVLTDVCRDELLIEIEGVAEYC